MHKYPPALYNSISINGYLLAVDESLGDYILKGDSSIELPIDSPSDWLYLNNLDQGAYTGYLENLFKEELSKYFGDIKHLQVSLRTKLSLEFYLSNTDLDTWSEVIDDVVVKKESV